MLLFLMAVVIPVQARAFQLAAPSAPRAYDGVGGALWASVVGGAGGVSVDLDKRLTECQKELQAAGERILKAEALLETTPDSEAKARILAAAMELQNTFLKEKMSLEAEKKQLIVATGPYPLITL